MLVEYSWLWHRLVEITLPLFPIAEWMVEHMISFTIMGMTLSITLHTPQSLVLMQLKSLS